MISVITGANIITQDRILNRSAIVIKDDIIESIILREDLSLYPSANIINYPENYYIVPGFIDMHIHGANGSDVMDASEEALTTISKALMKEGTTSYLATTMTASIKDIEAVLDQVNKYKQNQHKKSAAKILGVHLEGPFISPTKVGAQRKDLLLNLDVKYIKKWQKMSDNSIKLITLAPELANSLEFISYLKKNNIIASMGHTNASYAETMKAIGAGCTQATHLFNAMLGIHQREPGTVTASLLSNNVMAELIVDGVHLHPAIVELAYKVKTPDKLVLVSDAIRAKCLSDGVYDLGGQNVNVKNGIASLKDGTLAGSTLKLNLAIKNMMTYTQCNVLDIVKMTSENPAKALGVYNRLGSLAAGKVADIVVLSEKYDLVDTFVDGVKC